jgi:hypothetical protein
MSALALVAAPAQAGGPTSAFLSIPGSGQTSSLYYTDPEYDELAGLVGVSEPTGTFGGKESGSGHANGPGVTITWLIHDVEPWRVDRVYLGGQGEVWISTQSTMDGSIWEAPVLWHQPENGARLAALLGGLGLGEKSATDSSFEGVAGAPLDAREPTAAPPQTIRDEPAATAGQAWLTIAGWTAGGLAAGVLLTLAWAHLRRRDPAETSDEPSVSVDSGPAEMLVR